MKHLPSKLFPHCTFEGDRDVGFYDITPAGFDHLVSIYLGVEVVRDDAAIAQAGVFFDQAPRWDALCRDIFASAPPDSKDGHLVKGYFDFYKEEAPQVFDGEDAAKMSMRDMVRCLRLCGMASHGNGPEQVFTVDFTLGYDQLLCAYFDRDMALTHIAFES